MEKMQLAQVDRHYFDPKAAVHLKEYRLELWASTDFLVIFDALSFILDVPNSFWSGSNIFGQVQIIKINP